MKIFILTTGSRGDVQPFAALGCGLREAGHKVFLAGSQDFAHLVQSYDLGFSPIMGDTAAFTSSSEIMNQMKAANPLSFLLTFRKMLRSFHAEFAKLQERVWEVCQEAEALIYHPGMINGFFISRELGIPGIMASPFPLSPTREFPSLLFYAGPRLGIAYNRVTHNVFKGIFWRSLRPSVTEFWRKNGKGPSFVGDPFGAIEREELPILYSFSRHVISPPADWADNIAVTGYWFPPDREPGWQAPEDLASFLESGPPPVYVGFGSVAGMSADDAMRVALRALRSLGLRAVVASSSSEIAREVENDSEVFLLKEAPHTWLFPKMAAVVHHGGSGTTAAGLRAGVPSLIVPHTNDQPMWARRVSELGVGFDLAPVKRLSTERFVRAVSGALTSGVRERAASMGRLIREEDGVGTAVQRILRHFDCPPNRGNSKSRG